MALRSVARIMMVRQAVAEPEVSVSTSDTWDQGVEGTCPGEVIRKYSI
jgi:hypothetical protein